MDSRIRVSIRRFDQNFIITPRPFKYDLKECFLKYLNSKQFMFQASFLLTRNNAVAYLREGSGGRERDPIGLFKFRPPWESSRTEEKNMGEGGEYVLRSNILEIEGFI